MTGKPEQGDTPKEARFRAFVADLIARGIKPTPKEIATRQGDEKFAYGNRGKTGGGYLSGSLSTIRIQEFKKAGWRETNHGWEPPR